MRLNDIKKIASKLNIKTSGEKKSDLILSIQDAEGNIPCYRTERRLTCPESDCLWEKDCKK